MAQKKKVAAEPKASRMRKTTLPVSANETSVAHLEMSIPNGATNIPRMPSIMKRVRRGRRLKRPSMSSMLRLPMRCSTVPTHRNRIDLDTVWKMMRKTAAQAASAMPTPAQAAMRPRFAIVEYASTRLALLWLMAMKLQSTKVTPPTVTTMMEAAGKTM